MMQRILHGGQIFAMRGFSFLVLLAGTLCLTGCGSKTAQSSGYRAYYTNEERTTLQSSSVKLSGETTQELLEDLWRQMQETQSTGDLVSVVPENLTLQEMELTGGQLTLTFGTEYLDLDNVTEILFRAAMVEGAVQFEDVKTVVFHVGEDVLRDHSGEPVGAMTGSTFINNPVGINSYQYASLTLYFSNFLGNALVKETRNVHYSSNTKLEKVVMEQLLKGPSNKQLSPTLSEDVEVLDIEVEDKTCTLNLNQAFLEENSLGIEPEVIIYSIVDSLCDVLNVDKVQFRVNGSSDVVFGENLSLAGPFHRNGELIETGDSMTTLESNEESDLAQPSIGL